jgi:hypothetical protein
MFEARDIYCKDERIPKKMIRRWKEDRIVNIFVITVLLLGGSVITAEYMGFHVVNFNYLSLPMQNNA